MMMVNSITRERIKAAKTGHIESQIIVGCIFCEDVEDKRKFSKGLNFLTMAASRNSYAQYLLSKVYHSIVKDEKKYFQYLEESAKNEFPPAIHELGCLYFYGNSVPQNLEKAFHLFSKGAQSEYCNSYIALGNMYHKGLYVQKNIDKSIFYYEKAAKQKNAEAYRLLGILYYDNTDSRYNPEESYRYISKSAEMGDAISSYLAGIMCYDGEGCEMDYQKALNYYTRAATQGYSPACIDAAKMYIKGEGCKKNYFKAQKWLIQAINLGNNEAYEILESAEELIAFDSKAMPAKQNIYTQQSVGESMGKSTFTGLREYEVAQKQVEMQEKEKREYAMKFARARTPGCSVSDNDLGIVFDQNGEIAQYVDFDLDLIREANGSTAYINRELNMMFDINKDRV
ncbi:MAG: tetratricopeptide repeat protein, partial [Eubacterium sp.]